MRFWAFVLAMALVMMALGAGGCGSIAKKSVESATGVSVDESGDSITIKGDDGSSMEVNSGEGKLAEGFPDEIPLYDGAIRDSSAFKMDTASTFTALIGTNDSIDDVRKFYDQALAENGWKTVYSDDSASATDRMLTYSAENTDWGLTVTVAPNDGEIQVAVTAGTKQK